MDRSTTALTPSGDITIFEVAEFRESLLSSLINHTSCLLDLSQVNHIDAAGAQVIVAAQSSGRFAVTGMRKEHRALFEQIGAPIGSPCASDSIDESH